MLDFLSIFIEVYCRVGFEKLINQQKLLFICYNNREITLKNVRYEQRQINYT